MVDRIRLPLDFDAAAMLEEIEAMHLRDFIYYDVLPLRAPAHLVDPSRPAPPPTDDGSWTDWLDTPALKGATYLSEVIDVLHCHI